MLTEVELREIESGCDEDKLTALFLREEQEDITLVFKIADYMHSNSLENTYITRAIIELAYGLGIERRQAQTENDLQKLRELEKRVANEQAT